MQSTNGPRIVRFERMCDGYLHGYLVAFAGDRDAFLDAVEAVKCLPVWLRSWRPREHCWFIRDQALGELMDTLPTLRQYIASGQAGTPPPSMPTPVPADVANAFATLHLTPSAPASLVSAARRVLARLYHPDTGGDLEAMVRVNDAADRVEAWLRHEQMKEASA